jgi:transglutaminase-like putative cysteine protease
MERVKGVATLLWQISSMWRDEMSREEREKLHKKVIDWHERSQLIDDDDPEGTVQDCFQHIQKLEDWYRDATGQNLEGDLEWDVIATSALSAREHSDLIKDMEVLNEINISRNVEKYNDKFERIQRYRQMFDDHDLMTSERKKFEVSHYPKFPTETLIDREGTCDDVAILFAALLNDCGYPVRLFRSVRTDPEKGEQECMGVAVAIEGASDSKYFEQSNSHKGMIYCEATTSGISCAENVVEDVSGITGLKMIEV